MIQSRDDSDRGKEAEGNNRMKREAKKRKKRNTLYSFILEVMQKERAYRFNNMRLITINKFRNTLLFTRETYSKKRENKSVYENTNKL